MMHPSAAGAKPMPVPRPLTAIFYFAVLGLAAIFRYCLKRYRLFPTILVTCLILQGLVVVGVPLGVIIIRWRSPKTEERPFQRDEISLSWLPSRWRIISHALLFAALWLASTVLTELQNWAAASVFQVVAFLILAGRAIVAGNLATISARKLLLDALWLSARLLGTWLGGGRLPRKSATLLHTGADAACLAVVTFLLAFSLRGSRKSAHRAEVDTFPSLKLAAAVAVLALALRVPLVGVFAADVLWSGALYLEAVAMLPQLWMIAKSGGVVEEAVGHHMAAMFTSRLMVIQFWWRIKGTWHGGAGVKGYSILAVITAGLILLSHFMSYYFKGCYERGLYSGVPVVCAES